MKGEGISEYLKNGWEKSKWRRIARFRLGNEIKEGRYWETKKKKNVEYAKIRGKPRSIYGRVVGNRNVEGTVGRRR